MSTAKVIYLGSYCNKDCSYCDRGYIKNEIGDQRLNENDLPILIPFILDQIKDDENPMICFHGGEPFLYTKIMSKIIDAMPVDCRVSILTNGTLLEKNKEFLDRYKERLNISISYDFYNMKDYRGYSLAIDKTLELLKQLNIAMTQLQWVIPMDDKNVFNSTVISSIIDLYKHYNIGMLTLIPMRHMRGKTNFKSFLDEVNIKAFMKGFLQLIQLLYVLKIKVSIDGHSHAINKDYFNNHKQIILSPDGYIYPEFDFLDYKIIEASIGNWKEGRLERQQPDKNQILTYTSCYDCSQFSNCGIKYLYKLFDQMPSGRCKEFYELQEAIVKHYSTLAKHSNLVEAVGNGRC